MNVEEALVSVIKSIKEEILLDIQANVFLPLDALLKPSIKQTNITPRQQNQFIIFRKDRLAKIRDNLSKNKKHKNSSVKYSKHLGKMWKNESKGIKDIFIQLFKYSKKVHKLAYPSGYHFPHRLKTITKVKHKLVQQYEMCDENVYKNVSQDLKKVPNEIKEIPMTNLMQVYDKNILKKLDFL